jgi:hypothetical protein
VIRFLFRTAAAIVATGIGLLVPALVLDGLRIDGVVTLIASDVNRLAGSDPGDVDPSLPRPQEVSRQPSRLVFVS